MRRNFAIPAPDREVPESGICRERKGMGRMIAICLARILSSPIFAACAWSVIGILAILLIAWILQPDSIPTWNKLFLWTWHRPLWVPPFVLAILGLAAFHYSRRRPTLPLKLPKWAGTKDFNDPKPGRRGYFQASGILYLGNAMDGRELWLRDTNIKTHMLIYGTTGSGKTVSLQSIAYNAFVLGTGLTYIDPMGDPKLLHELFVMARRVSREDDFLALDFMTGARNLQRKNPFRMSNTMNPFASAGADAVVNLVSSLLPPCGENVFQQKAMALLCALIPILFSIRDARLSLPLSDMSGVDGFGKAAGSLGSGLDMAILDEYLSNPVACVSLAWPLKLDGSVEECEMVAEWVDKPILDVFKAALSSLTYVPDKPVREQPLFLEQFESSVRSCFGDPLTSMEGMYRSVFDVPAGEIDMYDALFNRRILAAILPYFEKSPQECENLGKIIMASIKNSVSGGLGTRLESKTKETTGALPCSSETPGIIIVDEYAAIMMPGFEVILTQARSLGLMAIISAQDHSGMKGRDAKSCDQIVENTKIKLFMTMASAGESWDLARSLFGGIAVEERNLGNPEDRGAMRNVDKVSQFDLMCQIEGEFHAFYKGELIRGHTQYMVPRIEPGHHVRINRWIRTDRSPEKVKRDLES